MQLSEKPKSLFCFICGREFGTTSLSIHIKSCSKKFENQQSKKQSQNKIKMPEAPQQLKEILEGNLNGELVNTYNQKAIQIHKYQVLPKCRFCSRTFNEESLKAHQNGCSKKGSQKIQQKSTYAPQEEFKKPRTLTCCICGREFGLTSLKIHYPQCKQKFENDEKKKPKQERKPTPQFSQEQLQMINNKQDWTLQQIDMFNKRANGEYKQKAMVQCPNCNRKFLPQSFLKHKKNCVLINGQNKEASAADKPKNNQHSLSSDNKLKFLQFKKPRTLTCCICGRDFGLTSLKIHYPQCIQKFQNDEKKKPKNQRKQAPKFTQEQLQMINKKQEWTIEQIDAFNNKATDDYRDKAMVQCENCGRKFIAESYLKHKKNCALINGKNPNLKQQSRSQSVNDSSFRNPFLDAKKPRTLTCCVCGRDFGLTSLKIHYPQCIQKFKIDQKKKPANERKPAPLFTEEQLQMINSKEDWTSQEIQAFNSKAAGDYRDKAMVQCVNCGRKFLAQSYLKHKKNCILINGENKSASQSKLPAPQISAIQASQTKKPRVLMCHICGREFGLTSLSIHQPKCEQKFINQENKKVLEERKTLPIFPSKKKIDFDLKTAQEWSAQQIEQYNKIANDVYREESLSACPICGRKFFQQSLPKHLKHCQKNKEKKQTLENSSSLSKLTKSIDIKQSSTGKEMLLSKKNSNTQNKRTEVEQQNNQNTKIQNNVKENQSYVKKTLRKKIQVDSKQQQQIKNIDEVDQLLEQTYKNTSQNPFSIKRELINANKLQEIQSANQFIPDSNNQHQKQKEEQFQSSSQQETNKENAKVESSISIGVINQQNQANEESPQKKNEITKVKRLVKKPKEELRQLDVSQQHSLFIKQQDPDDLLTPTQKAKSGKGFAALRKKQSIQQAEMKECKICNRKFDGDRIQKHEQLCYENKQRQKKSAKNLSSLKQLKLGSLQQIQPAQPSELSQRSSLLLQRESLSVEEKIRLNKGFASPRMKQLKLQANMVECKGCNHKFADDKIQKHQQICKKSQSQIKESLSSSIKKIEDSSKDHEGEVLSIKRVACPKCNRKFLQQRLDKHVEICKAKQIQQADKNIKNFVKKSSFEEKKQSIYAKACEGQIIETNSLEICQKCGRKFNADRISKHIEVCKGSNKSNENTTQIKLKTSKEGIENKKQGKKTYNLQNVEVKNQNQIDERVACPKCFRKFASDRLQKHLNACKAVPPIETIEYKKQKNVKQIKKNKNLEMPTIVTPKIEQKQHAFKISGDDQYSQSQLVQCQKCGRKFISERVKKHQQICKGNKKVKSGGNTPQLNLAPSPKYNQQALRKTKNEFFNMIKDIKEKRVKGDEIQKQLDSELYEIQKTQKVTKKQNSYRHNSESKKGKQSTTKSVILPKI